MNRQTHKLNEAQEDIIKLKQEVAGYEKVKQQRQDDFDEKIARLDQSQQGLEGDRQRLQEERELAEREQRELMARNWQDHDGSEPGPAPQ